MFFCTLNVLEIHKITFTGTMSASVGLCEIDLLIREDLLLCGCWIGNTTIIIVTLYSKLGQSRTKCDGGNLENR